MEVRYSTWLWSQICIQTVEGASAGRNQGDRQPGGGKHLLTDQHCLILHRVKPESKTICATIPRRMSQEHSTWGPGRYSALREYAAEYAPSVAVFSRNKTQGPPLDLALQLLDSRQWYSQPRACRHTLLRGDRAVATHVVQAGQHDCERLLSCKPRFVPCSCAAIALLNRTEKLPERGARGDQLALHQRATPATLSALQRRSNRVL